MAEALDTTKSDIYREALDLYLEGHGHSVESELKEFVYAVWIGDLYGALEKGREVYGEVSYRHGEAMAHIAAEREWEMDIDRYLEMER